MASVVYPEQLWVIADCPPSITRVAQKMSLFRAGEIAHGLVKGTMPLARWASGSKS